MKTITAIIGTPHGNNSNTIRLTQYFLDLVKSIDNDINYEIISLGNKELKMCVGCLICEKTGKCNINDDLHEIQEKLLKTDLVILGSPVYCWQVSAQFKALIDRMLIWIHTQRLIGKPAITVSTTSIDGLGPTQKYLNNSLYMLGLIPIGNLQWIVKSSKLGLEENIVKKYYKKLSNKVVAILNGKKKLAPKLKNTLYFWGITRKIYKSEHLLWDKNYLDEKGWLKLNYKKAMKLELINKKE